MPINRRIEQMKKIATFFIITALLTATPATAIDPAADCGVSVKVASFEVERNEQYTRTAFFGLGELYNEGWRDCLVRVTITLTQGDRVVKKQHFYVNEGRPLEGGRHAYFKEFLGYDYDVSFTGASINLQSSLAD
jgi:hypothetical protein